MSTRVRIDRRLAQRGGSLELLRLPAWVFSSVARLRGRAYDRGWLPSAALPVPVVSIGNLSAGGTGKTPCVALLARMLHARSLRPGILSRGYGAERQAEGRANDEAGWFDDVLPGVPHVQDPDRVRGAQALLELGVEVILLDDGFQHRRLRRDLDLVLIDASRPWGLPAPDAGGTPVRACLPRGFLREPPESLARADALLITRIDQVQPEVLAGLHSDLGRLAPGRPILSSRHRAARLTGPAGERLDLEVLRGREVELLSALGNPEAFQRTVEDLGARVCAHHAFPDHYRYRAEDLAHMSGGGRWVLCSEKDAVKLAGLFACHVLGAEFELLEGRAVLEALLDALPSAHARLERAALHEGLHG